MSHSPSPQRRRIVTVGEYEPRPLGFAMTPTYEGRKLIGITIQDPEGSVIRKRANIVAEIHQAYPEVSIEELENAKVAYFDYHVDVELRS
ncbi:unnamed protein product [marine sediment metagenome]|uniref:Uncharacterized protein n=1 Tax=marine sediment metagenome TaxID=412755 RepID=X1RNB6_9ZZZZ